MLRLFSDVAKDHMPAAFDYAAPHALRLVPVPSICMPGLELTSEDNEAAGAAGLCYTLA